MVQKIKVFLIVLLLFLLFLTSTSNQFNVKAATLQISSKSLTLSVNHYKTLYISGTHNRVSWSSSNSTIAAVNSTGRVTAKNPGTATITARVSGKSFYCKVKVINLSSSSAVLTVGASKTLTVNGSSDAVTWYSDNPGIAAVSSLGKVTAKAYGSTTVYASLSGKKLFCTVTVLKLSSNSITLNTGDTKALKVYGTTKTVCWSSDNNSMATVASSGVITAKSAGTTKVTAAVLGIKLTAVITVNSTADLIVESMDVTLAESEMNQTDKDVKIIGYYAAWSRYSGFTPNKIDASKLTIINYAFANIGSDLKIILGFPDIDPTNISSLNQLKQINPNLKTVISVGGWSWSQHFSDAALTQESRAAFADSCIDFLVKYNFDGVDIDWEYPVAGGFSGNIRRLEDKYNFTLLLKILREKLDARGQLDGKRYLLSFAGAAGNWYLNNIEADKISQYVDYVNLMTYDLHGSWDTYTDLNAPLYSSDPLPPNNICVDKSVNNWLKAGFSKNKIVMGVPFFGYIYKGVPNANNGFGQTFSGGASISYANIAANYLLQPEYQKFYHTSSRVPWLFNGSTFISYENEQSMTEKAQYVRNNGLSGVMIWELSQDPNKILLNSLYQELTK